MGFSRRAPGAAAIATEAGDDQERMASDSLPHAPSPTGMDPHIGASASLETAPSRQVWQHSLPHIVATTPTLAIAERFDTTMSMNFRAFADQVDAVIKANSAAKVIPSAEAIAEEVLMQQHEHVTQEHGTRVSREQWNEHRNEVDMGKDADLAYRETDETGREIYCPVCLTYCGSKGDVGIASYRKLNVTKACIERHLSTFRHKQALQMHVLEVESLARRTRVGLTIGKTVWQTLREGCSYL